MSFRSSEVIISQGCDMIFLKLENLVICVGFQNIYDMDLEGLVSDMDLVIFEGPYSSTS